MKSLIVIALGGNLTANAARPNPQGSYHYGTIPIVRTLVLANSAPIIKGKPRYAINKVSYKNPSTPLKLADYYNISGVYNLNTIKDTSPPGPAVIGTSVVGIELHDFVEIVFQNDENAIQSYHLDGSDFWVVGFGSGQWNSTMRKRYNLFDATTRYTAQDELCCCYSRSRSFNGIYFELIYNNRCKSSLLSTEFR